MAGNAFRAWERIRADGQPVVAAEEAATNSEHCGQAAMAASRSAPVRAKLGVRLARTRAVRIPVTPGARKSGPLPALGGRRRPASRDPQRRTKQDTPRVPGPNTRVRVGPWRS
jgi:hypothetical protein